MFSTDILPNWNETKARWTAYWTREATDRPCIDVTVVKPGASFEMRPFESAEDTWFDPEWVGEYIARLAESRYYLGESFPNDGARVLMTGWTHGCGASVGFSESTIWVEPAMASIDNADGWHPGDSDPWRHKTERLLRHLLSIAKGRFAVTYPYQLPLNDVLPMLMGPEALFTELSKDAAHCGCVLRERASDWIGNLDYFRRIIEADQEGCFWGWPGMWSPDFVVVTQSDVSCMIGPVMFEQYVMPELDAIGERYERLWYHLDGKGARRHLPRLLQAPYIKAVQYVPSPDEAPNGPAHLDLYRRIQSAGRCVDLTVAFEDVEYLVRRLRPEGLALHTLAPSVEAAAELLDIASRVSGADVGRDG